MHAFIQELVNQFYSVFSLNYEVFRTGFALLCMLAILLFSCTVFLLCFLVLLLNVKQKFWILKMAVTAKKNKYAAVA